MNIESQLRKLKASRVSRQVFEEIKGRCTEADLEATRNFLWEAGYEVHTYPVMAPKGEAKAFLADVVGFTAKKRINPR